MGSPFRLAGGDPSQSGTGLLPKGVLPRFGGARLPDPPTAPDRGREQAKGETASSNYWSATSNANNPSNAWNVNLNNGNVNNNNKTNNNWVVAVRGGP